MFENFEWGWNWDTFGLVILAAIVILLLLQIFNHLMTDVASKDELRRIIQQELHKFFEEKHKTKEPKQ